MFSLKVDEDIELKLFQPQDSQKLYQLIKENHDHLREWLPWVDQMVSRFHFDSLIPFWLRQYEDSTGINAGILYNKTLVGSIALQQIDWQNKQSNVGYFLAEKAGGHGIMTKTVRSLLRCAFIDLGLNRIEIRCGEKNKKSRAIPERLGFTIEGRIREGERLHGHYHDLILYSMLSKDWHRFSNH
jgi:ribosomal-protein-serine acetyltransferase